MTEPLHPFKNNSFAFRISREEAIAYGHVKPTPEEVEQTNAKNRDWWEASVAAWEQADTYTAKLAKVTDTVARIVLDIHRPTDNDTAECRGCPVDHDEYREPWPCITAEAVSRAVGIEPFTGYLGHRPGPEPHVMPAEGYEPFVLPRMDAFARAFDEATMHGIHADDENDQS